jgi:hypothetical protein
VVPITRISRIAIVLHHFRFYVCTQTTSPPEPGSDASAAPAPALVLCNVPSGWLGGATSYFLVSCVTYSGVSSTGPSQ